MKNLEIHYDPTIHTTGAFLQPIKVVDSEGKEIWLWYVSEFTGDTFDEYGETFNPKENAGSMEELLTNTAMDV
jgi:hypothetical protein